MLEAERLPLTAISSDEWSTQVLGHMGAGASVVIARSTLWPGASCAMVMKEDKCANLYVSTPRHSNSAASRPGRAAASRPHGSHAARC